MAQVKEEGRAAARGTRSHCAPVRPGATRIAPISAPRLWLTSQRTKRQRETAARGGRGSAGQPAQPMCMPPLQEKSAPVEKPLSSLASQVTMEPISSGVPRRLTGMVATIFSSTSGLMALTMSVPM